MAPEPIDEAQFCQTTDCTADLSVQPCRRAPSSSLMQPTVKHAPSDRYRLARAAVWPVGPTISFAGIQTHISAAVQANELEQTRGDASKQQKSGQARIQQLSEGLRAAEALAAKTHSSLTVSGQA